MSGKHWGGKDHVWVCCIEMDDTAASRGVIRFCIPSRLRVRDWRWRLGLHNVDCCIAIFLFHLNVDLRVFPQRSVFS